MSKPKRIKCFNDFLRLYLPDTWAEMERKKEEKRVGLGVVIARKMLTVPASASGAREERSDGSK